ncbi:MAG: hypothetical protein ABI881_13385 [Betaproteobacteria bacterium]
MADRPEARELLGVAREALLALIGDVEPRHHYTLRMVANAIAIAGRELVPAANALPDTALMQRVVDCDAADTVAQQALHRELVAVTRARLAISNPKFPDSR